MHGSHEEMDPGRTKGDQINSNRQQTYMLDIREQYLTVRNSLAEDKVVYFTRQQIPQASAMC